MRKISFLLGGYEMSQLILASASPRRYDLLTRLGVNFVAVDSGIEEAKLNLTGLPEERAVAAARAKARQVALHFADRWVLGADTIVVLDGKVYGKPENETDAARMLAELSGKTHLVVTGVTMCRWKDPVMEEWSEYEKTWVRMGVLSKQEIAVYVRSGEPMDKAGAYGIQDRGAFLVQSVDGCYFNVVGLPLRKTGLLLLKAGIPLWRGDLL
jgi:septum formation protein